MDRPNIILITSDQQRYDTLGCNGSKVVRTPVLDALATQGSRFERAYINNPVCIPSRACIQTGRYTHQHGVRYMESRVNDTPGLPFWEETFMERLQAAGYATGAAGKIHMFPPKGFDFARLTNGQGQRWTAPYGSPLGPAQLGDEYAAWLEAKRPGAYAQIYEQRRSPEYKQFRTAVTSVLSTEEYVDYWAMENALEFINQKRESPFFLWLGFCNPHGPVDAPAEYARMYDPQAIELSDKFTRRPDTSRGPSPEVMQRWIAHYYGLCTMLDDLTGKVFDALKAQGLWENTLIIYTSDHGEMMGDFGRFGKGNFLEPVIRVPLVVKPPEPAESSAEEAVQRTVQGQVELIDLAPTILDYAGVPVSPCVQGSSVRPMIQNSGEGKEAILCEYTSNDQRLHGKCLRTERYKYACWTPDRRAELYDLREDPDEWSNVADDPAYARVRIQMQDRLIEHLSLSERPVSAWA